MANPKPSLEEEREALLREQRELRATVHREFPTMTQQVAVQRNKRLLAIDERLSVIRRRLGDR